MRSLGRGIAALFTLVLALGLVGGVLLLFPGTASAATYTVTLTTDTLPNGVDGELRYAINQANANAGPDTIEFDIPGDPGQVHTIAFASSLPHMSDTTGGTTINGYTQDGAEMGALGTDDRDIKIQIDGTAVADTGFVITSSDNRIEGLSVYGFVTVEIDIFDLGDHPTGNVIAGNYLGTDATGSEGKGGAIRILIGASSGNTVGGTGDDGNLISGANSGEGLAGVGIVTMGGTNNLIQGNYIGTDYTGMEAIPNELIGVFLYQSDNNTVGGPAEGEGNLISGNAMGGIAVQDGSQSNLVLGNILGLNRDCSATLPSLFGIVIASGGDEGTTGPTDNYIGGDGAGEGNVVCANSYAGILIGEQGMGGDCDNNFVEGNFIGTGPDGTGDFGNQFGVIVGEGSDSNTIGGSAAASNVIRNNSAGGVLVDSSNECDISYNTITDNGGETYVTNRSPLNYGGHDYDDKFSWDDDPDPETKSYFLRDIDMNEVVPVSEDDDTVPFADGTQDFYLCLTHVTGDGVDTCTTVYLSADYWPGGPAEFIPVLNGLIGEMGLTATCDNPGDFDGFINQGGGNPYTWDGVGTVIEGYSPSSLALAEFFKASGVNLETTTGCTITDNIIDDNEGNGVGITDSTGAQITDNHIHDNAGTGVVLWDNDSLTNRISENSFYGNDILGIGLGGSGIPTENDGDNNNPARPNRGYNYPEFDGEYLPFDGTGDATLTGTAPPNSTVEIYRTGETPDASGHGQGDEYLTSTTAAPLTGQFTADLTGLSLGDNISAIAISPAGDASGEGNTSEFSANIEVEYPPPTVTSITPKTATNDGKVNITNLAGTGFRSGATAKLSKSGKVDIVATNVKVVSATKITCTFDITGKATGAWDLTVTNDDGKSATLEGAFTVTSVSPPGPPQVDSVQPSSGVPGTKVTIKGSGFGSSQGDSVAKFNGTPATEYVSWSDTEIVVLVPEGATSGRVQVITASGESPEDVEFEVTRPNWYLAEGSTAWGFDTYVTIENPNDEQLTAGVTYMTAGGPVERPDITLPPQSQTVFNPRDDLGGADFSTLVTCKEGKTIAADRRMIWTGEGAASQEGHASIGVTSPAKTWYLPEGSSDWAFECWLLIQNPNTREATCQVTYMVEGEGPQTFEKKVPGRSRSTFNMAADIGAKDASIKVSSDIAVVPERAMYRNARREGHCSIGTTAPAQEFYLAEGSTAHGFTTYVLVQNPNPDPASVTVTYMTGDGAGEQPAFTMEAESRKTIRVNDALPGVDFSTRVAADMPIVAERAMYWDNGTGEAGHDSIGMSDPHTDFYLPDGETTNGHETWTLIANPNSGEVKVEISYLTPTGEGNETFTDTLPAQTRRTYDMAEKISSGRAAVIVRSLSSGKKVMVERAMYFNNRGAGTSTIGGFSD